MRIRVEMEWILMDKNWIKINLNDVLFNLNGFLMGLNPFFSQPRYTFLEPLLDVSGRDFGLLTYQLTF